jgi:hypothetical protein
MSFSPLLLTGRSIAAYTTAPSDYKKNIREYRKFYAANEMLSSKYMTLYELRVLVVLLNLIIMIVIGTIMRHLFGMQEYIYTQ